MRIAIFLLLLILAVSCNESPTSAPSENKLFRRLSAEQTGIVFSNTLSFEEDFDVFRYRNYYNGAGVGIGDINNDGLPDLYLTSNMGDNKLFLNKGNMKFEDITAKAGVAGSKVWSTGVSMADVNSDGLLDIYVCNSGDVSGGNRENELFINNGDLTFKESAASSGLADNGYSTHAVFFDYDRDGDLDCYVLNNSFQPPSSIGMSNRRGERDDMGGDKLYRNDKGKFSDVSEESGIFSSLIGFGLGVTAGDVNQDGWPDIYVSNDFFERDYLYINNQDGTFTDKIVDVLGQISMFSMGADIGDLDNDGHPEIFSTDMLPKDDYRLKTLVAFETYDVFQLRVNNDYHHQYMRNMLHKNNRDGSFSEIGRLAGVAATDWSWGALIADFDNDGYKDIFVSNGIFKDVTNQDFVDFLGSEQIHAAMEGKKIDFTDFLEKMPSQKISNFMFQRAGEWRYNNVAAEWGLDEPSFSNGAAYGDLDNDGDLDLVVNNVNQELFIYQNQTSQRGTNHSLRITFKGDSDNPYGVGASVMVQSKGRTMLQEHYPIRGYQSSMDYEMIIGVGKDSIVDSVTIRWPDGQSQLLQNVKADQLLTVERKLALGAQVRSKQDAPLFTTRIIKDIAHQENEFDDFDQDRLAYHMLSTQGPAFAKADLNGDGYEDLYIGGSAGSAGTLYLQKAGEKFVAVRISSTTDAADETAAVFFDADNDGDQDLYVVTGGTEYLSSAKQLRDRYYENLGISDGVPIFEARIGHIPLTAQNGSCVMPSDIDGDGDLDLFVGSRSVAGAYGVGCDQYILQNDGKGKFTDVSATWAPSFAKLGMVSDACWFDYDGNGFPDLLLAGEWMPLMLYVNNGKHLERLEVKGFEKSSGWWNSIRAADVDLDGDLDFVIGNLGLNSRFASDSLSEIKLYVNDFDQNGSTDPVFTFRRDGKDYPITVRNAFLGQMTSYKKDFVYHKDYADKSVQDIFSDELIAQATVFTLQQSRTSVVLNQGSFGFVISPLPIEAQFAPVYAALTADVNNDHLPDLLMGGNLFAVKPEAGRYDALHGIVMTGDGHGQFKTMSQLKSGFNIPGEIRHLERIRSGKSSSIIVVRNNAPVILLHSGNLR